MIFRVCLFERTRQNQKLHGSIHLTPAITDHCMMLVVSADFQVHP